MGRMLSDKEKRCVRQAIAAKIAAERHHVEDNFEALGPSDIDLQKAMAAKLPDTAPHEKKISLLWEMYGLTHYSYYSLEQVDLLKKWIVILYGKSIAKDFNLQSRVDKILKFQSNALAACNPNSVGLNSVSFPPMIDDLISDTSWELPEYT